MDKSFGIYIQFKPGVIALGLEEYKGITVVYINDDKRYLYQTIINGEVNAGESDNIDNLRDLAHKDIDDFLNEGKSNEEKDQENK